MTLRLSVRPSARLSVTSLFEATVRIELVLGMTTFFHLSYTYVHYRMK